MMPEMTVEEALAETVITLERKPQPVEYEEVTRTYDDLLPDFDDRFNLVKPLIEKNRVLAREVRRLQADTMPSVGVEGLLADLARYDAMRCETCRHQRLHRNIGEDAAPCCSKTAHTDDYGANLMFPCDSFNNGCRAWEAK